MRHEPHAFPLLILFMAISVRWPQRHRRDRLAINLRLVSEHFSRRDSKHLTNRPKPARHAFAPRSPPLLDFLALRGRQRDDVVVARNIRRFHMAPDLSQPELGDAIGSHSSKFRNMRRLNMRLHTD
jgi:hypothetical protein